MPVIVLTVRTGTEGPATHVKALRLGAAIVMRKPSSNAELTQAIFEVIQKEEEKKNLIGITMPTKRTDFSVKYDRRTS